MRARVLPGGVGASGLVIASRSTRAASSFHVDASAPPELDDVRVNMQRLAALGLDIYITELDVTIADGSAEQLRLQADLYAGIVLTCLAVPACRSATVFG
jgi:GH35 family endo-1,4-beta-xylanase